MKGIRGAAIVLLVCSLLTFVAAVVYGQLWTSLFRGGFVVVMSVLAYRVIRHPPPPRAWTRQQTVASLAIGLPSTLVVLGLLGWLAVVTDELLIRVTCLASVVLVLGFIAWVGWVTRKNHLAAVRAKQ